ncbi:MAG TPA: hypothetical protein ENN80_12310, partial [Candidatus Hydrogenedentes bacterium]|nr:hypothetical protein [Candidatus Hydrogenedentota bacterium]
LWLTYSRGAMIGLALALVFSAILLVYPLLHKRLLGDAGTAATAFVALCVVLGATLLAAQVSGAEESADTPEVAPPPPSTVMPIEEPKAPPVVPGDARIVEEGRTLGVAELTNLGSLKNRLSYWETGIHMAKANFLKGVGLGNFRTAYPKYQPVGGADVKMAHNDYLQTLCETGIFGLAALLAFWIYFALWGARRILGQKGPLERLLLAGLYCGILSFLAHSLVDFNFYNPSLAFFLYMVTGLFYVLASPEDARAQPKAAHQVLGVPFLIVAALVSGMALRTYLPDYIASGRKVVNVGDDKLMQAKLRVGEFFLRKVQTEAQNARHAMESIETLAHLIPLRSQFESFGQIWVPSATPGGRHKRLDPGAPVPPNAFFVVTDPGLARQVALQAIERWLEGLKMADSIFPYDPEMAAHFVGWYDLLLNCVQDPEKKREYTLAYLDWAEASVRRSPLRSWGHEWYAKGLWLRANMEREPTKEALLRKGLDEFRTAMELYPSSSTATWQYGDALSKFARYLERTGREEEAGKLQQESRKLFTKSEELAQKRRI